MSCSILQLALGLCVIVSLIGPSYCQTQCAYEQGYSDTLTITNAETSEEIQNCIQSVLPKVGGPENYKKVETVRIISPNLTSLSKGSLLPLYMRRLDVDADNLEIIENGIMDFTKGEPYNLFLEELKIKSAELKEINEEQFRGCLNLREIEIYGTKLEELSFSFTNNTNMRKLVVKDSLFLRNITPIEAVDMAYYTFVNTSLSELPPYMFKGHRTVPRLEFRSNLNFKAIGRFVFHGATDYQLRANFYDTPIEIIESDFVDMKEGGAQLLFAGNRIGKIEQKVFQPILEDWKRRGFKSDNFGRDSNDQWIKWDLDTGRTSTPVICDCSLNWLVRDKELMKFVHNAYCQSGQKLKELKLRKC